MKSKILMTISAIVLAVPGLGALFAPQELLTYFGAPASGFLPPLVQLFAAALLGLAMTNWAVRGSKVGGIYNRPIALGNLMHFTVGAFTLVHVSMRGHFRLPSSGVTVIYALLGIAFGTVVFGSHTASRDWSDLSPSATARSKDSTILMAEAVIAAGRTVL